MELNSRQALEQRYHELCAKRDATDAAVAPLKARMHAAAERADLARVEATELRRQIEAQRGGFEQWVALKREIGQLADRLKFIAPRA